MAQRSKGADHRDIRECSAPAMQLSQTPKIASYVMTRDVGFAPNPFYGFCTLAACTPNHKPYKIEAGDWIIATSTVATGNKLIHAMRVSEVMDHDRYFRDKRFARKKPSPTGSWRNRCGDNIYHRNRSGQWVSEACVYHTGHEALVKDTRYSRVFIAKQFYYFGEEMIDIPESLQCVVRGTQGLKYIRDPDRVERFLHWLTSNHSRGMHGLPRHRESGRSCQRDQARGKTRCKPRKC